MASVFAVAAPNEAEGWPTATLPRLALRLLALKPCRDFAPGLVS
jgi:hypothetical protein